MLPKIIFFYSSSERYNTFLLMCFMCLAFDITVMDKWINNDEAMIEIFDWTNNEIIIRGLIESRLHHLDDPHISGMSFCGEHGINPKEKTNLIAKFRYENYTTIQSYSLPDIPKHAVCLSVWLTENEWLVSPTILVNQCIYRGILWECM